MTRRNPGERKTTAGRLVEIRPNVWKARVYVGTIDGREVVRSRTFEARGERAAERRYDGIATQLRGEGTRRKERGQYLAGLADEWFEIQQGRCSPTTIYRERPIVERIKARLGHIRVDELGARDIERFYAWLRATPQPSSRNHKATRQLSESTVHHHHRVLSAILNTGERWDRGSASVLRRVDRPKPGPAKVEPPTAKQILAVVKRAPGRWGAVFTFAAQTGMRRGEICAARWSDLTDRGILVTGSIVKDGDTLVRKATKTERPREVELAPEIRAALAIVKADLETAAHAQGKKLARDAYLFPDMTLDPTGRAPTHPDHVSQTWRTHADAADVPARFHDLRHYAATHYLRQGVSVNDVAAQLGHAQTSTTVNVYGHKSKASGIAAAQSTALQVAETPVVSS